MLRALLSRRSRSCLSVIAICGASLGALSLAETANGQTVFPVFLDGGQVATPTPSVNKGAGHLFFNPFDKTISYDIMITGLTGPFVSAQLHRGSPGDEGTVILSLVGGPSQFSGISSLNNADIALLRQSKTYVTVRSGGFPTGEIRGQVTPTRSLLYARLSGDQVTPPSGSGAKGDATFQIHTDKTVTYNVHMAGMGGPATIAHLHRGQEGQQGPIIHGLSWTSPGLFSGTTAPLDDADIAFLRAGHSYVDVHSIALPNGEARGQVETSYTPYRQGCYGVPSGPAQLFGGGTPRPGGDVTIAIANGVPNQGGILFLGAVGADIPFEWGCQLLVGPPWIPLVLPPLNANGGILLPAQLPLDTPAGWLQLQYFGEQPNAPGGFYSTNGLTMHVSQ